MVVFELERIVEIEMQESGSTRDRDWLVADVDPCVCRLSRCRRLCGLTASSAEKTRLSKIKNIVSEFKDGTGFYVC